MTDPKYRCTGKEALEHPWFSKFSEDAHVDHDVDELDLDIIKRLQSFKGESILKKAAMNMLVKMTDTKEFETLKAEFQKHDKDGTGMITEHELHDIFKSLKIDVTCDEIHGMITEVDYQGNGKINYSEFLAATLNLNTMIDDAKLKAIFEMFDTD